MKVMTRRDALKFGSAITLHRLLPGAVISCSTAGTKAQECQPVPWDLRALSVAPKIYDAPQVGPEDVKAIFFEGEPWKGNPTRVFAYFGLPQTRRKEKGPAVVLVHRAGGSRLGAGPARHRIQRSLRYDCDDPTRALQI